MGVCTPPDSTSGTGTASIGSTTAAPTITDSDPTVTDSDPAVTDSVGDTTDSDPGPLDTGASCIAPGCNDCDSCGNCTVCASTPVSGACDESCAGDPQCMALVACALMLDNPADFPSQCCGLPCADVSCEEDFKAWRMCVEASCGCRDDYSC